MPVMPATRPQTAPPMTLGKTEMRVAVYPGTFDPVTNGHMDVISRAVRVVDKLVIAVASNLDKQPLFSLEERTDMVRAEIHALNGGSAETEVRPFDCLLMDFVAEAGASIIVRGLRAVSDFEYEFQMASMNRRLNPKVETVFLTASETNQFIASRFVKDIGRLGGDISHFVSPRVAARLTEKFAGQG